MPLSAREEALTAPDDRFAAELEELLAELTAIDSFHGELRGCQAVAERLAELLRGIGFRTAIEPQGQRAVPALIAGQGPQRKGVLLLGHTDTVHPKEQGFSGYRVLSDRPERATGPGVADMKGGLVVVCGALLRLARAGLLSAMPIRVLFVGDEELGSPDSEALIRKEAEGAEFCLCFEAGRPVGDVGSTLVSGRRGCGQIDIIAEGVPAHAGVEPWKGASALLELCAKVAPLTALTDRERGLAVTVGELEGGTSPNTVPAFARMAIDYRFPREDLGRELEARIRAILETPVVVSESGERRVQIRQSFEARRAALERTEISGAIVEAWLAAGRDLGQELIEEHRGGSSDAALAAEVGCPSVCGLGAVGDRFHTPEEWVLRKSLDERARLLALFLARRFG